MKKQNFTLQELYTFVPYLKTKYPNNNFVEDKIRQQLQVLRDKTTEPLNLGKYKIGYKMEKSSDFESEKFRRSY